jgi:hypothetical protein
MNWTRENKYKGGEKMNSKSILSIAIVVILVVSIFSVAVTAENADASRITQKPIAREMLELGKSKTTINIDGDPSDWAGIDPIVIDPQNDTVSGACKDDILEVYVTHDENNIYFRVDLGCINETYLYLDLDADQDINTGYNTNEDPNDWYLKPHDTGFDYMVEIDTTARCSNLYKVDQGGEFTYIGSYPVGLGSVIEVGVPLISIGEFPNPKMNMDFQTYYSGSQDEAPDERCVTYSPIPPEANWTFMVYLDADNNLESCGIDDLNEMEIAGSIVNDVNIVVLMDCIDGYDTSNGDWTGAKIFYVMKDSAPSIINSIEIKDLGEVNMGDPNTLINFTRWTMNNFPAKHSALILWDHGNGWKLRHAPEIAPAKGICWDDTNDEDCITSPELKHALATISEETGVKLDIVGFDACLMAMIEVDYQIMPYADVRVGSEEVEPGDGWPYDSFLLNLTSNTTMTPDGLATQIVNDYIDFYGTSGVETQSAIDLNGVDDLAGSISVLAQAMIDSGDYDTIASARVQVEEFDLEYIDLYHFAQLVSENITTPQVQEIAQQVMNEICNITIAEAHGSQHPNAHGISIYFPETENEYLPRYEKELDFTNDTQWDEFLVSYYTSEPDIWIAPEQIDVTLPPDTIYNTTLTIGNSGTSTLRFDISDTMFFADDMESGVGGWTHGGMHDEWELGTPMYGPSGAHSGSNCWGTDLDDTYDDDYNQWLMSPAVNLRGTSSASLNFYRWYNIESGYDYGYVEISTDNESTWTELKSYTGAEATWTRESIDISAYTGYPDVKVRFRLTSDYFVTYAGLYIDDVAIIGTGGINWLSEYPTSGGVSPDSQTNITVTINTTNLSPSNYNASIFITSNDPDEYMVIVPVNLVVAPPEPTIISRPKIQLQPNT